jgi:hypothetical protein
MLPAKEAWRISGEGLFTEVPRIEILGTSPLKDSPRIHLSRILGRVATPCNVLATAKILRMGDAPSTACLLGC